MDAIIARDAQFALLQMFVGAVTYMVFMAWTPALFYTVLASAMASLFVTAWSPSVFTSVLAPLLLGGLPGVLLGYFVTSAIDDFVPMDAAMAADAPADPQAGETGAPSARPPGLLRSRVRLLALFAVVLLYALDVVALALSLNALRVYQFIEAGILCLVHIGMIVLMRPVSVPHSKGWTALLVANVTVHLGVTMTIVFTESLAWTAFIYVVTYLVVLIGARILMACTSDEVRRSASALVSSLSEHHYNHLGPQARPPTMTGGTAAASMSSMTSGTAMYSGGSSGVFLAPLSPPKTVSPPASFAPEPPRHMLLPNATHDTASNNIIKDFWKKLEPGAS